MPLSREQIAMRAAAELKDGMAVNLGIGIPTLVANYLPPDARVWLHSENGLLGMGPFPFEGEEDPQIINAGKQTVTIVPGGSTFDSSTSFAMIRGGHIDLAILGALEVSERGDIANWMVPGKRVNGMGGAMDLVSGARRVIAVMSHTAKDGTPKLVDTCTLPLTGPQVVDLVITDLAVVRIVEGRFVLEEVAPGLTAEAVQEKTGAKLHWDSPPRPVAV